MNEANPDSRIARWAHRSMTCGVCRDDHLHRRPKDGSGPWEPGAYLVSNETGDTRWKPLHPPSVNLAVEAVRDLEAAATLPAPAGNGSGVPSAYEVAETVRAELAAEAAAAPADPFPGYPNFTAEEIVAPLVAAAPQESRDPREPEAASGQPLRSRPDTCGDATALSVAGCEGGYGDGTSASSAPPLCWVCANDRDVGECPNRCRSKRAAYDAMRAAPPQEPECERCGGTGWLLGARCGYCRIWSIESALMPCAEPGCGRARHDGDDLHVSPERTWRTPAAPPQEPEAPVRCSACWHCPPTHHVCCPNAHPPVTPAPLHEPESPRSLLDEWAEKCGPISFAEAHEIAQRFCTSHFRRDGEKARISIPANPMRDDDIRLLAFIRQQELRGGKS